MDLDSGILQRALGVATGIDFTGLQQDVTRKTAQGIWRAIGREELLLRVWGVDPRGVATRTVDMAVARLREQLRDDPDQPRVIITVRGKGYMLAAAGPEPLQVLP